MPHYTSVLEINVGEVSSNYEVWVEKSWLDMKIAYLGLERHVWEAENLNGVGYYNVSLTSGQTPTTVIFKTFVPTDIPTYTRGNPDNIELWDVENETFPVLPPMIVEVSTSSSIFLNITIPEYYPVRLNQSWLDETGVDSPSVIVHDNKSIHFTLMDGGDLIVLVDSSATLEILQNPEATNSLGRVDFIDAESEPEYSFPSFQFLPAEYDPFHPFHENATLDDFEPPRSLVFEDVGIFGHILDPKNFSDLGVGLDFLPDNKSHPYEVGIWTQNADLYSLHENLSLGYDQLKNERESPIPFIFRYGHAMIPLDEPMDMWNARAENTVHAFDNPYIHGPVKDRLHVPLTWFAGSLSLCKLEQVCQDTRELEFTVYENETASPDLTSSISDVLLNVTKCLEDSLSCPLSEDPIVEFVKDYRTGIINGTFSNGGDISIDITQNSAPVTCTDCGLESSIEEFITGARRMIVSYASTPEAFELTPDAMTVLGCRDPDGHENQTFDDCKYDDYLNGGLVDEAFPYLNPTECIVEEALFIVEIVLDPVIGKHVSIDVLDLSDCLGLGDALDLGDTMIPLGDIFRCFPSVSDSHLADCESGDAVKFLWNINPLNYAGRFPCPLLMSGLECATLGTALGIGEIGRHTGKAVAAREIDIGGMPCRGSALTQAGIDKHPRLHQAGNSAFYLTFSPWYCFDNSGSASGHAGKARNFPIYNHFSTDSNTEKTPTVVWMWSAAAPWLGPHEFGHAFGPAHEDGKCTETGFFSFHPYLPHSTHMKFTGDKKTNPECQDKPIWLRHLHHDYTPGSVSMIIDSHETWKAVPASTHAQMNPP